MQSFYSLLKCTLLKCLGEGYSSFNVLPQLNHVKTKWLISEITYVYSQHVHQLSIHLSPLKLTLNWHRQQIYYLLCYHKGLSTNEPLQCCVHTCYTEVTVLKCMLWSHCQRNRSSLILLIMAGSKICCKVWFTSAMAPVQQLSSTPSSLPPHPKKPFSLAAPHKLLCIQSMQC